ncbi:zinc-binding dehydrogenase [Pseudonocardia sp. MCCB 268]|nr:zinc-binding dehydrogenase [Pseudonocardia cytotoxica]
MRGHGRTQRRGRHRPDRPRRLHRRDRLRRRVGVRHAIGAHLAGATTIIAVDTDPQKTRLGPRLQRHHTINARRQDPVEAIRAATDGFGADVVIDAVVPKNLNGPSTPATSPACTVVLVGVPPPTTAPRSH